MEFDSLIFVLGGLDVFDSRFWRKESFADSRFSREGLSLLFRYALRRSSAGISFALPSSAAALILTALTRRAEEVFSAKALALLVLAMLFTGGVCISRAELKDSRILTPESPDIN